MGNKEDLYIQERWYLLNRFIQELSIIEYLWKSDEVKAFIRPTLEVEKSLVLMPKLSTDQTLQWIMTHLSWDEQTTGEWQSKYNEQIQDFKMKAKKAFPILEKLKEYAKNLTTIWKHHIHQMTKFTEFLSGYEENTLGAYAISEFSKNLLFADPTKEAVKDGLNNHIKKMSNPYTKFRYWVKEEICDLNSILEAIYVKELIENKCEKTW